MTVRQVFYQATVRGIVDKDEKSYNKVQQELAKMRRDGTLPFDWIVDNTRGRNHPLPLTAWRMRWSMPPMSTGSRSGTTPTPTSRSGWRRMRWQA